VTPLITLLTVLLALLMGMPSTHQGRVLCPSTAFVKLRPVVFPDTVTSSWSARSCADQGPVGNRLEILNHAGAGRLYSDY